MKFQRAAAIAVSAGLISCTSGGGDPAAAQSGTPRNFTRDEGTVSVQHDLIAGTYTATRTITLGNDASGITRAQVSLTSDQGSLASGVYVSGGGGPPAYRTTVDLSATAKTEAQAREALATMTVSHRDATDPGVLYLDSDVSFQKYDASNVSRSASLIAYLPQEISYDLYEHSGTGTLGSSLIHGTSATLDAGSGSISFDGTWDSATFTTGSGSIRVSGDIAHLDAQAGSGTITATVAGQRATQATFSGSVGSIDVTAENSGSTVFDLDARTTTGTASISVAGTSPQGTQSSTHAHAQSPGYANGSPKVVINGSASTGSVTIHD